MKTEVFKTLSAVNVNDKTEKKKNLTYLSWAWAWQKVKENYPNATYEVSVYDGKPYIYDENLGYMVQTLVNIEGEVQEMFLPVMDGANKAMKAEAYFYETRSGKRRVEAASMFDINKTIMRCLVKNLAMFGLGLYIYAGEDLPEGEEKPKPLTAEERLNNATTQNQLVNIWGTLNKTEQEENLALKNKLKTKLK